MYSLGQIKEGLSNPRAIGRELNRLVHTRGHTLSYNPAGTAILDEYWDNLIILDACRFDYFERESELPGRLDYRYSRGATTSEFIRANFSESRAHDTVYISSNGWYLKLRDKIDSEIYSYVDLQADDKGVRFYDETLRVPEPGSVTRHALSENSRHPNKRLIIHYLQPHQPYLGTTGEEYFPHRAESLPSVVDEAVEGATLDKLHEAYAENLNIVLSEVGELLTELPGRTVVTADHGEMLGDRYECIPTRDFGHHGGVYTEALVKVPWHVSDNGPRKEITSETPIDQKHVDEAEVNERLRELGYRI